jgi:carbonic anhydrase
MIEAALISKQKLIEGNERFVRGESIERTINKNELEELAAKGQKPFALIVCCSDSRVPPELLFDQGFGDIFVVRTAGNVVDEVGLGSIEYGAEHLHIPLIVVLGHENCGAVKATIDGGPAQGAVKSITDRIYVSYSKLKDSENIYAECEDENIRSTINEIKGNPLIAHLISAGKTEVIGAKYGIRSGEVRFF